MKYFHCPKEYKRQAYGCGAGPYNGTVAFLDLGGTCRCGKELKPWKRPKVDMVFQAQKERQAGIDTVRELFGESAANDYAATKPVPK